MGGAKIILAKSLASHINDLGRLRRSVETALNRAIETARQFRNRQDNQVTRRLAAAVSRLRLHIAEIWPPLRTRVLTRLGNLPVATPDANIASASTSPNPVLRAATPLLALMMRLPDLPAPANIDGFRQRVIAALRRFLSSARVAGVEPDLMRVSHVILCAVLDDIIGTTAWGRKSNWSEHGLISTFHQDIDGVDCLITQLDHIKADPEHHIDQLELAFICTGFGYEGQFRYLPNGASGFRQFREEIYRAITAARPPAVMELSPSWRGESAQRPPITAILPPWVLASIGGLLLTGLYMAFAFSLGGDADRLYQQMAGLLPDRPAVIVHLEPLARPTATTPIAAPAPPPPAAPATATTPLAITPTSATVAAVEQAPSQRASRLRNALADEIAARQVYIVTNRDGDVIRIPSPATFQRSSDALTRPGHELIERLAKLLDHERGRLLVVGHTDDRVAQSVRFPSSLALSEARARAVARVLVAHVRSPERVDIEGRADTDPIVPNTDATNRERNRRVEIMLSQGESRR
ncbi:MAG: type IVB secretion system protein IcmH/DotU [Rhodospirillaceae bacterium]